MFYLIIFILILIILILVLIIFRKKQEKETVYQNTQQKEKEKNKKKILQELQNKQKITNNDIEKMLNISDATATRYLDDLEKQGKIKQVGKTGKHVYYEKSNGSTG